MKQRNQNTKTTLRFSGEHPFYRNSYFVICLNIVILSNSRRQVRPKNKLLLDIPYRHF